MEGMGQSMSKNFYPIILPLVVGVATSGLIFQWLYFFPVIRNSQTRILMETLNTGFYIMCFISYYQAIRIRARLPETLILPRHKSQLVNNHFYYTQKKQCEKENQRYKPPRTSHCHMCKCVPRMDHHCPYTNSCVGAANLKAFILFCFYGGIFALVWLFLSVMFYWKLTTQSADDEKEYLDRLMLGELEMVGWMTLSVFSFFLSLSMNGIWISQLYFASKNITQLDLMKGHFTLNDKHGIKPNPFDLGILTNLNTIFNGDYWLFWLPTENVGEHDDTEYPLRPPVTRSDIKKLPASVQEKLVDVLTKSIPSTIEQLRKQEQSRYDGVVFFYLGQQYRLTSSEIKKELETIERENSNSDSEVLPQKTEEELQILSDVYEQQ